MATFGLVAIALAVVAFLVFARHWVARLLVSHALLRNDGIGSHLKLVPTVAKFVIPVRMTGLGNARQRFDLSMIDERPDTDLCGVPAGELAQLRNRNAHLIFHPAYLEIWIRSGLSYQRVAAFPKLDLHDVTFIVHDPDDVGITEQRIRGSVGTLEISFSERLRLYLLCRVKPRPELERPTWD